MMNNALLSNKEVRAYLTLTSLVICGLAISLFTAQKVVHFGINFPFSNIVFSIMTYPIVDCICELWGKQAARQAMWMALISQLLIAVIINLSIATPHAAFWQNQVVYQTVLGIGINVVFASLVAFSTSQLLDIYVYQAIKEYCRGKKLWLRCNISMYLGQAIDSIIFVNIVFYGSAQKLDIILGSIMVKIILSFLMTPIVYLIIFSVNKYLDSKTLAFRQESTLEVAA